MLLIFPATVMLQSSTTPSSSITLRDAAAKHRILFGSAVAARALSEPDYAEALGREFSQAEPENEMKFASLHPRPDTDPNPYNFKSADEIVAFAQAHRMKVRGHCFVWHQQVSRWITSGTHTPEQLATTLHNHIDTVAKHYAGKVYAWDVVNEAFEDDGSVRHSVWFDRPGIGFAGQGTAYIEQSFRWARAADRKAKLYYNDYGAETINRKSDAIYAMVQDFKKRRVPINGVGFQMHINLGTNTPETLASIKKNFRRFGALGVDVQITELDVSLENGSAESLAKQAATYRAIVEICLGEPRCNAIQTWGFTDKHSWSPQFSRGKHGWALLFDENYAPKPSYKTVLEALTAPR